MFNELSSHGGLWNLEFMDFTSTTTVMELTMPYCCNEDCHTGNIHEGTH